MPEESPPGLVSLSHPVDIAAWNQSVSQSQFSASELFPADQDDFQEMANQFLDPNMFKDDASMTSSMDDSTYMSQPDTARHHGLRRKQPEMRRPTDVFHGLIYSPAPSTSSHGGFPGAQSDMNQLFNVEPDFGENALSEFANFPSQGLRHNSQSGWTTDSQAFSRAFTMGSVDAIASQHGIMSPAEFVKPSFPHYSQASPAEGPAGFVGSPYVSTSRPRPGRIDTAASSHTKLSQRRSSFGNESDMAPRSATTPRSIGVVGSQYVQSPASAAAGKKKSILSKPAFDEESFPAPLEPSTAESIVSQEMYTEATDDGMEASLSSARPVSEEADVKRARSHDLYTATPGPDDLYHCPFKPESGCNHSPTKLKCNYDKYVDSHLKPFRCKVADCVDVQFSSTACLLRHEREAHAMHGHGSKPHLCYFAGCERSLLGHGFPRRYNLFDHMKRVHDYVEQPTSHERTGSPVSAGGQKKAGGRKRKSTSGAEDQPEKRPRMTSTKAGLKMPPPQRQREQRLQRLNTQWTSYRDSLQQRLLSLQGPRDLATHQQINEDIEMLSDLSRQITDMG